MQYLLLPVAVIVAVSGAYWDIRTRRLPNMLCILMAVTALLLSFASGGTAILPSTLAHGISALSIGMILFSLQWIGGGDAKFYAACAFAIPLSKAPAMLFSTSIFGLVLVLATLAIRSMKKQRSMPPSSQISSIPYGVAIGFGFVTTLLSQYKIPPIAPFWM